MSELRTGTGILIYMTDPPLTLRAVAAALTSGDGYGTHIRTSIYFLAFLGALGAVLCAFPWRVLFARRPLVLLLAPSLSLTALLLTWRLILIFFVSFTTRHAAHPDPPNLFVEACRSSGRQPAHSRPPHAVAHRSPLALPLPLTRATIEPRPRRCARL